MAYQTGPWAHLPQRGRVTAALRCLPLPAGAVTVDTDGRRSSASRVPPFTVKDVGLVVRHVDTKVPLREKSLRK